MQLFEISYAYKFLGGFYLAMAVLHLILFMYNPSRKANLVYALGMLMVFINFTFTQEAETGSGAHKLNILTDLAANAAILYFVTYYIIPSILPKFKKIIQLFAWVYATGCALVIINSNLSIFSAPLEIILRSTIYIVIGASCIIGLVKKIPNFYLIVIATLLLMIMWVFFGADLFNVWHKEYPVLRVLFILLGFISPFIAYSHYLSRYLSVTKKNLLKEHIINEQLSLTKLEAEKIQELDQVKSRFFANISHEFRTPLALILAPLEKRLKNSSNLDDKIEYSIMHKNTSRLLRLVNQLLDLSRLETGTIKIQVSKNDIVDFVLTRVNEFQSLADIKRISLQFYSEADSLEVYFDSDKIEKAFNNILANAFKFTSAGQFISVVICQRPSNEDFINGYAEVAVHDGGIGIGSEHITKIFDRFYQADNSLTREFEGSGIGLALVKEFIELHHGSVSVSSEAGKGSTFTLCLPLGPEAFQAEDIKVGSNATTYAEGEDRWAPVELMTTSQIHDEINIKSESILIIEDNAELRYYLKNEFIHAFRVFEAADGEEGLAIAIKEIPTLIITDLMMAKKDGLSLCHEIKQDERTSHIPVILLTAKADVESRIQGYREGADDYIPKPFSVDELQVRIQNLITSRKQLRTKFATPSQVKPSSVTVNSADERFLIKVLEVVERSMTAESFGVEPLAREMGVSQTQLYRKLHAVTGFSPNEFVRHIRLLRAAELLLKKVGNVSEVAYQVGFNNLSYFAKVFKEKFGTTPMEFLKTHPSGTEAGK